MRRVRYQVACSLDGYIAGPNDEFDWITPEPSFDFEMLHAQFDIILMGRRTFEIVRATGEDFHGKRVIVASRSLRPEDYPGIEIVSEGLEERVRELRMQSGRDIWLYGGGDLFSQLLSWDLVDTVEPAIIPILLGGGVQMLSPHAIHRNLTLVGHRAYPSGLLFLEYEVQKQAEKFVRLGNLIQLSYYEAGSETGVPLILLHGLADSWHVFERLLPYLPESLHIYAITQRGHGNSSCPDSGYRTTDFKDDLLRFMDALDIEKAVILGASSGGFAARSFAVDHPERTLALLLLGVPATLQGIPVVEEMWRDDISKLTDTVSPDFVGRFASNTFSSSVPQEFVDMMLHEYHKLPARVWRETTESILQESFPGRLNEINCPALILWGDHDRILNRENQDALAKAVPGSRLVIRRGAGHMFYCEDPEGVASEIIAFMDIIRSRGV